MTTSPSVRGKNESGQGQDVPGGVSTLQQALQMGESSGEGETSGPAALWVPFTRHFTRKLTCFLLRLIMIKINLIFLQFY